jgi:hypothetical protein
VKAWLKKWWWVLLLILAAVGGLVLFLIFRKEKQGGVVDSFSARARREIVEAETTLEIEKLKAKANTEAQENRLKEIEGIKDGVERRVRLAKMLDDML